MACFDAPFEEVWQDDRRKRERKKRKSIVRKNLTSKCQDQRSFLKSRQSFITIPFYPKHLRYSGEQVEFNLSMSTRYEANFSTRPIKYEFRTICIIRQSPIILTSLFRRYVHLSFSLNYIIWRTFSGRVKYRYNRVENEKSVLKKMAKICKKKLLAYIYTSPLLARYCYWRGKWMTV